MIKKYILSLLALIVLGTGIGVSDLNAGNQRNNTAAAKSHIKRRRDTRPDKQIAFQWHRRNLERHFQKHRSKFPEYKTSQEYGRGAIKFFSDPPAGTKFKRRPNGDRLFYYEKNNLFGVTTKDGTIKTFFRPNRGIRYWNRQ